VIPCHRVIARGGALQGYAGGLKLKARLLAMESAATNESRPASGSSKLSAGSSRPLPGESPSQERLF